MDVATQVTLGAAVGEAALGSKAGSKAAAWGAVCGLIPDLDILCSPFVSEAELLAIHRGITHSFVFAAAIAPVLGRLIQRLHKAHNITWVQWSWLVFWATVTHPILDSFTMYGTQVFQPFSNYPVAFSSIFIIDPMYTLPLLAGVITALVSRRNLRRRRIANILGLSLSSAYLVFTLGMKLHVESVFERALHKQNLEYERLFTTPMPLSALLWMGIADNGQQMSVGLYSIFDRSGDLTFQRIAKNSQHLEGIIDEPVIQRLLWFSRGFYTIEHKNDEVYFNDARFGRDDNWLDNTGAYIFSFRLLRDPKNPGHIPDFRREAPPFDMRAQRLNRFFSRVLGNH